MKLEKSDTKHPQIFFEAKLYNYLQGADQIDRGIYFNNSKIGIPRIYD